MVATDVDVGETQYARAFACPPIYDVILSCLSFRTLVRLALTCRIFYRAVANYKTRAFNINSHLSPYFSSPIAFRSLQAKTNTLISGSNALQFLDRSFYPESDLDLYAHPGHSFEVARFLVEVEGYAFAPSNFQTKDWKAAISEHWDRTEERGPVIWHDEYSFDDINAVFTFQKSSGSGTLKVQIITASASPVQTVLNFHSTCVMNVISSDAAYALYPLATLEERTALGMPRAIHSPAPIAKYTARGWRVHVSPCSDDGTSPTERPFQLDKPRWVGDKHTLVVPLDQTGIQPRPPLSPGSRPLTFDPVRCYGWKLLSMTAPSGYACATYMLHSNVFRYNYAFPDEKTADMLIRWAMKQGKRRQQHVSKAHWTWFDDEIPSLLRAQCNHDIFA